MDKVAKGLYVNKDDEKEIVFVFDTTDKGGVIYTEALHPVVVHHVDSQEFNIKYKKVHRVEFAEINQ